MMFNQYPYLNVNDLNLDYILSQIKVMMNEVTNFVSINAIKYADPIQWDITRQYEKNTVVIDPVTGTAYISVAPVPAGVALTRPEYWTVVFDLGSFVTRAAQNFTSRYEQETTLTATFPTNTGEWLVWGDVLYKAKTNIIAGDTYVVDSNIEHFTMEDLYNAYLNTIANILAMVGDLADLTTSDKTSVVNAINSVVSDFNTKIGDLDDLTTTDKSNVVNAISEVNDALAQEIITRSNARILNVRDYGAKGDGVADDTAAIQACANDLVFKGGVMYFPAGKYYITDTIDIGESWVTITGCGELSMIYTDTDFGHIFNVKSTRVEPTLGVIIENLCFHHETDLSKPARTNGAAIYLWGVGRVIVQNIRFSNQYIGVLIDGGSSIDINNCYFNVYNGYSLVNGVNFAGVEMKVNTDPDYPGSARKPQKITLYHCGGNGVIENNSNVGSNFGYLIYGAEQVELIACEFSNTINSNLAIIQTADSGSIYEVGVIGGYYDCSNENGIRIIANDDPNYAIFNTRLVNVTIKASGQAGSFDGLYVHGGNRTSGTFQYGVSGLQIDNCLISLWNRNGIQITKVYDFLLSNSIIKGYSILYNYGGGLVISNSKHIVVTNNRIGGGGEIQGADTSQRGIGIDASTDFIIQNNDLRDNVIEGLLDLTTVDGNHKRINNNLGYNDADYNGITTMTTPASGTYVYNPTGTPIWLSILCPNPTPEMNVSLNNQYIYTGIQKCMIPLGAGDRFKLDYDATNVSTVLYWKL